MSASNSPCAACKCRRQKCSQDCIFAPYFFPEQTQKFMNLHNVYGASNIGKLLNQLNAAQREDAVNCLAYEAEIRLLNPVYGCGGLISILQHNLKKAQYNLNNAKQELTSYIGPSAIFPPQHSNSNPSASGMMPYNMQQEIPIMESLPTGVVPPHGAPLIIHDTQQQQHKYISEAQPWL